MKIDYRATVPDINWGGLGYSNFEGFGMAAAPVVPAVAPATGSGTTVDTGAGSGSAAPPAAGNGTGTGSPSSGQGTGTPGSSPSPGSPAGNDPNIATIRQSHETIQKLGGPEKVTAAVERYNKVYNSSKELATRLNYTEDSFEAAFAEDPIAIHNHLMAEAKEAANGTGTGNGNRRTGAEDVNTIIEKRLAPITSILAHQQAKEANARVDTEFDSQLGAHTLFKGKQVPAEVRNAIYNSFTEAVKYDQKATAAILKGDVSVLKPHFDKAVADQIAFANGYQKWLTGTGTSAGAGAGAGDGAAAAAAADGGGQNPFSLNDIIEGNDNATKGLKSLRNFR